jgi:hypothetical protein
MAKPVQALISTFVAGAGVAQSGFATFTFIMTNQFEAWPMIIITNPNTSISTGAEVQLYRSANYGLTWETRGTLANVFNRPTVAAQVQRNAILITPGWYLVSVQVGGGVASTWTAQIGTAWAIDEYA